MMNEIDKLKNRIEELEKNNASNSYVIAALVELLQSKNMIQSTEVINKVNELKKKLIFE